MLGTTQGPSASKVVLKQVDQVVPGGGRVHGGRRGGREWSVASSFSNNDPRWWWDDVCTDTCLQQSVDCMQGYKKVRKFLTPRSGVTGVWYHGDINRGKRSCGVS